MNQKELNELRRRFRLDKNNFSRVYGCYVNSNREIIAWVDTSMGLMRQEEQEMYLGLLKKSLSGTLGKNLIDVVFSTQQVADSDEHRLLQTLRQTELKDPASRETLCRQIIDCIDMGETNYLILLAADAYDVPHRSKDDEIQADASSEVFKYFVCSICPVKAPTLELRYDLDQSEFHSSYKNTKTTSPELGFLNPAYENRTANIFYVLGFLYPAFDNRTANIYNVLFYSKNAAEIHQEVIDALFHVDPPMSAEEQKNAFGSALADALDKDCSYDVVQSVHEQIRARIEDHKESKDPEPLEMTAGDVGGILANSGVNDEQIAAFQRECDEQYGENAALNPNNIIESKKFEITTPEVKISIAPENSYMIEARVINGRKYLLIPADDGVEVNGIGVNIPGLAKRNKGEKPRLLSLSF